MMLPSLSVALAAMVTVAGRVTLLLSVGVMMLTVGGMFGAVTVMLTAVEVVLAPLLSVATAVKV